jgi:hypothetical protein
MHWGFEKAPATPALLVGVPGADMNCQFALNDGLPPKLSVLITQSMKAWFGKLVGPIERRLSPYSDVVLSN